MSTEQGTRLTKLAHNNNTSGLKELIKNGVSVNHKDEDGDTALIVSAFFDNKDCVKLLIEEKAELDILDDNNRSAVDWSIIHNNAECAALLILAGADTARLEKEYKPMYDNKREEIAEICTQLKKQKNETKKNKTLKQSRFHGYAIRNRKQL